MTSNIRRAPDGQDSRPPATLSYGDEFGPYIITGFAGCGATSYVYRARRRDRYEPVAIKVLHPHLVADPTRRLTFYREARIMMRMDHPNVVRFEEIIEHGDTLAFVMEYIDGVTLKEWFEARSPQLDEVELACVFVDLLRGVTAAHDEGIVHRDLKPGNVLISTTGQRSVAKIIDFGVARFVDEEPTERERSKIIGTAAYVSPEEVGAPDEVCRASDIYSIGVMLYEAACGRRPFDELDVRDLLEAHVRRQPKRPRSINPGLSTSLEEVILQTLSKHPKRRISSAPELIGALETALHRRNREATTDSDRGVQSPNLDQAETTQWDRGGQTESNDGDEGNGSVGGFFKRCLEAAFVLMTTTGAEADTERHFLNRSSDAMMPFR